MLNSASAPRTSEGKIAGAVVVGIDRSALVGCEALCQPGCAALVRSSGAGPVLSGEFDKVSDLRIRGERPSSDNDEALTYQELHRVWRLFDRRTPAQS